MIYSPIIDFLASISLTRLVTPSDQQTVEGETACWCPLCKGSVLTAQGGEQKGGSPHFIIYNEQYGGLYNCNDGRGAQRWMCTKTKVKGHGALELYAEIHHLSLEGNDLRRAAVGLLNQCGYDPEEIKKSFPYEHPYDRDLRGTARRPTEKFSFQRRSDLTPQELRSLGCEVAIKQGESWLSFGDFSADKLRIDFRTYSLSRCTLPAVNRQGVAVSEEYYGTPFSPMFITFLTPDEDCGCIWRPATDYPPIVFTNSDLHTINKVSRWLAGDKVFMYSIEHYETRNNGVWDAFFKVNNGSPVVPMDEYEQNEYIATEREEYVQQIDEKTGEPKNKWELEPVEIPKGERKVQNIVFCDTPQDAIATYYTVRNYEITKLRNLDSSNNRDTESSKYSFFHTCFSCGRNAYYVWEHGAWAQRNLDFSPVWAKKMSRFAERPIILFPQSRKRQFQAFAIVRSFRQLALAMLPEQFKQEQYQVRRWFYGHRPNTVRDFILNYQMSPTDRAAYPSLEAMFLRVLTSALTVTPLERKVKRDRNGAIKKDGGIYYQIDQARIWQYMLCVGIFRGTDPSLGASAGWNFVLRSSDNPAIVRIISEKEVIGTIKQRLDDYAKVNHTDPEDYALMRSCINGAKELTIAALSSLPLVNLNYDHYGKDYSYFFFKNKALFIPKSGNIRLVDYSDLDFDIDAECVRDFNMELPSQHFPMPTLNPAAESHTAKVSEMADALDDEGNHLYTQHQIAQARAKNVEWQRMNRYLVDWQGMTNAQLPAAVRIIQNIANVKWELMDEYSHDGIPIPPAVIQTMNAHYANFVFCIGLLCWGFRGATYDCAFYVLEDTVADNNTAQGGSGKSMLIETFLRQAVNIMNVDAKSVDRPDDMKFLLNSFLPHRFRAIHWEDTPNNFPIKKLYNFVSNGIAIEQKGIDKVAYNRNVSPAHVATSNYPIPDTDNSTLGRFCFVPISDRYCRQNTLKNTAARRIEEKGFNPDSSLMALYLRRQMAYFCALSVQFTMNVEDIVSAPVDNIKQRSLIKGLTENFVNWANSFFSQEVVFGILHDYNSLWEEYKRDFCDASEDASKKYSLKAFKEKVQEYIANYAIVSNPTHLLVNKKDVDNKCFHLTTWCTQGYFTERDWEGDDTVSPKYIRIQKSTQNGVVFYRQSDEVPLDYKTFLGQHQQWLQRPDPLAIIDEETGKPVELTEEEQQRIKAYHDRKQGARTQQPQQSAPAQVDPFTQAAENGEPVPF